MAKRIDADAETRHAARGGVLAAMRRRRSVIVVCTILVPALALLFSLHETKQYSATATLLFQNQNYAQGLFGTSASFTPSVSANDPTRQAATDLSLVQQSIIASKTARELSQGMTQSRVQSYISVSANGQSDLVNVRATTPHPQLSAKLANTYAAAFIKYRRTAQRNAIFTAQQQVAQKLNGMGLQARNSPAGRELATRQQDLQIFASLQTGDAQLYEPATAPSHPSSPRPVRNTILGLFVGLLLGIGIALLTERLDRRVRDLEEFEEIFDRPILGTIQRSRSIAGQRQTHAQPGNPEMESFRTLRATLRYLNVDREIRSLLVTSAIPGEGKSTLAWNLAIVSAAAGRRVLLVEADMRRPVFRQLMGSRASAPGLSDFLAGQRKLEEVVEQVGLDPVRLVTNGSLEPGSTMDVIAAGPLPPNPADLLESERMASFLGLVEANYDVVIIDTPPTSVVSDALHLFHHVDGVIVVTRLGSTPRDRAKQLSAQVTAVRAPVLGIVVNGTPGAKRYGRYAGYGYDYVEGTRIAAGDAGSTNGTDADRQERAISHARSHE